MIETIDGAVLPVTPCPFWCVQGFHPWEYVHGEWQREHLGRELTPDGANHAMKLYTADSWVDGEFERPEQILVVGGLCFTIVGDVDAMARLLRSR